ncbi:carboxypeptidase M32 [Jeotgalibacillus haloalkalitolerans]|uniref:Metal-dependent carboxypeptidase n=1 Tax=Jeotgalibacillus haloalkalitolerans TaxID=3104292 RepID=A0ABU5KL35_9BACL|nr:carboxypeptidase M32 [Jeotgalibacillus sp. HH7-29]MDZ5711968.1 carboxypeptidase M32 [Jeotgalibacillus sp. HH7-29]
MTGGITLTLETVKKDFITHLNKISAYEEALGLIFWDLRTGAPKKAIEQRSEVIGTLSSEVFNMSTSDQMAEYIQELNNHKSELDELTVKMLEECEKEFNRNRKIPEDEFKKYVVLKSKAENVWEEAREKSDFSLFEPYLKELVDTTRRFIEYWGYEGNPYNTLLDMYEPGVTVEVLDEVFGKVREAIVPLVKGIEASDVKPETSFIYQHFPKDAQREFSVHVLKELGYDFEAGRLDETVHPFATGLNTGDVRITTRYDENDFRGAIFGTIHECGHALYEQNIDPALNGTPLSGGTSMGIHESQSLFMENFVGRHPEFWRRHLPALKEYSPEQFNDVSVEDFLSGINESKPSLIRVDADELTYALHIMIRYEIEKGLFNADYEVAELPDVWNQKYKEYLGIVPSNDAEGILQDVHWSGGSFGYFPSYALGYMYAAQFKHAMLKDLPGFDEYIASGDIAPIKNWMTEKVHRFGKTKKPLDILQEATGEGLNADYLIKYLQEKYAALYNLESAK